MDLGIKGRTALVCASSKGLGRGCAEALAAEDALVDVLHGAVHLPSRGEIRTREQGLRVATEQLVHRRRAWKRMALARSYLLGERAQATGAFLRSF